MHLDQHGGWMVVMAGSNHIEMRDGVPDRIAKRVGKNLARRGRDSDGTAGRATPRKAVAASSNFRGVHTVVPKSVTFPVNAREFPERRYADFVWFVERDAGFVENGVNDAPTRAPTTARPVLG